MTKTSWKAGTMLYPLPPVMVSCGTTEKPNVFTVAWTGIINSEPAMTYISVRPSRYSYDLIKQSGEFVINLTTAKMLKAADFCGVKSGRNTDKFAQTGLTAIPCKKVKSPMIAESPVSLECRVTEIKPLGSHDMFLAEITAVNVDDEFLNADGLFQLEKSGLIAFCHGGYYALGGKIGTFGFSVAKKKSRKQRISEIKHERHALKKQKQKETAFSKQEKPQSEKGKRSFSSDRRKHPAEKTAKFRKSFNHKKAP
ncbi:MAG: flavin reductase family protein [Alphaproteobacteria bacterium]|nr:flavin reductase family protein [Alphaproteobacteria bacterium]